MADEFRQASAPAGPGTRSVAKPEQGETGTIQEVLQGGVAITVPPTGTW